ncbi:Magnesium and cobalt efflux protein corC [Halogeometricum pallidum JCM 14848]|uniref:Magnesium and cobalt efflux protein corC n=1 Tax=Halogeometricum pallidum JCM 14848 TaxID=1227487 RepID=M0CZ00_HALPD|nr:hemolysin family protein [Halogeometricum pallidum]ELZ27109.1 Magnesium and cobalt efflux protein corC [Halogeometricum pallidum JCM 14848]
MVDLLSVGGVLLAFFLVFMNGLFVAAEFALVKVRPTQINALVEDGTAGASLVRDALDNLDGYLAVSQLGITLSSLGLGWVGEPAVAALIEPVLGGYLPESSIHLVSFAVGFGFITFLHVVFGELAPKTFAIQEATRISLLVAPLMKFFYYVFMPGIIVFNGTANQFTRLFGVSPASEGGETHSEEEIRMILARSEETGRIDLEEVEMIESVFELGDTVAREIMVPRPDVQTVRASTPLDELRTVAANGRFTRYLVLEDDGDQVVGFVHVKDILKAMEAGSETPPTAADLAREVLAVPETRRIDEILADFQARGEGQIAVVIDEWGVFEGIVTIEDVLEEIVGDIRDEFDTGDDEPSIERQSEGVYVVDGGVPVQRVNERLNTVFASDDVETIGGFVFSHLGRVPEVGDEIEREGCLLRVEATEDARIESLSIRRTESGPDRDEDGDDADETSDDDSDRDEDGDDTDGTDDDGTVRAST